MTHPMTPTPTKPALPEVLLVRHGMMIDPADPDGIIVDRDAVPCIELELQAELVHRWNQYVDHVKFLRAYVAARDANDYTALDELADELLGPAALAAAEKEL
jgi:hypothetical protein